MKQLKTWFVTRALETPLWFSGGVGAITLVIAVAGSGIEFYHSSAGNGWWVIGFTCLWASLLGWSAVASLRLHETFNQLSVLTEKIQPDHPGGGNPRVREIFADRTMQASVSCRWRSYQDSHLIVFLLALSTTSVRLGLCESAHWLTNWLLGALTLISFCFVLIPRITRAQLIAAGVDIVSLTA